jgi:hypothetical protein
VSGVFLCGAKTDKKYLQVACIGSRKDITTYCVEDDWVWCGCWNEYKGGALADFVAQVEVQYGTGGNAPNALYHAEYMDAIEFFRRARARWEKAKGVA